MWAASARSYETFSTLDPMIERSVLLMRKLGGPVSFFFQLHIHLNAYRGALLNNVNAYKCGALDSEDHITNSGRST